MVVFFYCFYTRNTQYNYGSPFIAWNHCLNGMDSRLSVVMTNEVPKLYIIEHRYGHCPKNRKGFVGIQINTQVWGELLVNRQ